MNAQTLLALLSAVGIRTQFQGGAPQQTHPQTDRPASIMATRAAHERHRHPAISQPSSDYYCAMLLIEWTIAKLTQEFNQSAGAG